MGSRLHVIIEGRVQGVGFRYAAQRQALELGLRGWVRNRPDGSVEAEFEGPPETLDTMLDWCRQGPRYAHVTAVHETTTTSPDSYNSFRIVG